MEVRHPQPTTGDRDLFSRISGNQKADAPLARPHEHADVGLRAISDFLPDVRAEMRRTRLVQRVEGWFDVRDPEIPGSVYEIGDDILRDVEQAFHWVRQLGEKQWVTKQTLCDLADAALAHIQQSRMGDRQT